MDLRQLQMFKTVAELGGFTKAGTRLFVSHSAISRQIKLLEEELHSELFVRTGRDVILTEAGRILLAHAEAILKQLEEARQHVLDVAPSLHRVHVGTSTTTLSFFLPPVLKKFRSHYPKLPLLITTGMADVLLEEIRSGVIDIGLISLPFESRGLTAQLLYREEFGLAVGSRHPLAKKRSVRAYELENLPVILYPPGSAFRRVLEKFFREIELTPFVAFELENEEAIEKAVIGGEGISFLSMHRASNDLLRILRVLKHPLYREVALAHRATGGQLPEHLSCFVQLCKDRARLSSRNGVAAIAQKQEAEGPYDS